MKIVVRDLGGAIHLDEDTVLRPVRVDKKSADFEITRTGASPERLTLSLSEGGSVAVADQTVLIGIQSLKRNKEFKVQLQAPKALQAFQDQNNPRRL